LTIPQQDNARRKGVRERTNVAPGAATLHSRFLFWSIRKLSRVCEEAQGTLRDEDQKQKPIRVS
jgi:hypothetical protein